MKHFCIENCNNEIGITNFRYGNKRCRSCSAIERNKNPNYLTKLSLAQKGKEKHTKETKEKISFKAKQRFKNPENHPMYGKEGKLSPLWKGDKAKCRQKNYCIENNCNKEVYKEGNRCKSCNMSFKYKINRRNTSDKNNPMCGKKHVKSTIKKISLAKGGTGIPYENTEYGSEFDSSLKEKVRFRDNYKCQLCNKFQTKNSKKLSVHHIDYNKKNNNINNLIILCNKCHGKTNDNRNYWIKYFTKIFLTEFHNMPIKLLEDI